MIYGEFQPKVAMKRGSGFQQYDLDPEIVAEYDVRNGTASGGDSS